MDRIEFEFISNTLDILTKAINTNNIVFYKKVYIANRIFFDYDDILFLIELTIKLNKLEFLKYTIEYEDRGWNQLTLKEYEYNKYIRENLLELSINNQDINKFLLEHYNVQLINIIQGTLKDFMLESNDIELFKKVYLINKNFIESQVKPIMKYLLQLSSRFGKVEFLKFMYENDINIEEDFYLLFHSIKNNHIEVVKFLLENYNKDYFFKYADEEIYELIKLLQDKHISDEIKFLLKDIYIYYNLINDKIK